MVWLYRVVFHTEAAQNISIFKKNEHTSNTTIDYCIISL